MRVPIAKRIQVGSVNVVMSRVGKYLRGRSYAGRALPMKRIFKLAEVSDMAWRVNRNRSAGFGQRKGQSAIIVMIAVVPYGMKAKMVFQIGVILSRELQAASLEKNLLGCVGDPSLSLTCACGNSAGRVTQLEMK